MISNNIRNQKTKKKKDNKRQFMISWENNELCMDGFFLSYFKQKDIKKKKPLTKPAAIILIIKNVLQQECDNSFKLVTLMKYFQLSDGE